MNHVALKILRDIEKNRREIEQIFIDVASWNENHRPADAEPIDPDPDGSHARMLAAFGKLEGDLYSRECRPNPKDSKP